MAALRDEGQKGQHGSSRAEKSYVVVAVALMAVMLVGAFVLLALAGH